MMEPQDPGAEARGDTRCAMLIRGRVWMDGTSANLTPQHVMQRSYLQCDVGSLGKQNLFLAGRFLARAPNRIWNLA
jgi:hypothetical protein